MKASSAIWWERFGEARARGLSASEASGFASGRGALKAEEVPPAPGQEASDPEAGDNSIPSPIEAVSKLPQEVPPGPGTPPGRHPGGRPQASLPLIFIGEMRRRGLTLRAMALQLKKRGYKASPATLSRRLRRKDG